MEQIKPKFKEYQEEHAIVNFMVPKSWRPKLRKLSKIYGMPYSHFLRDVVGFFLRDNKLIK